MHEVTISEHPEQATAVIRETVPLDQLTEFFGRVFAAVTEAVAGSSAQPVGPPFALYYGMPTDTVDVEAGMPIVGEFEPIGEIKVGTLPGGPRYEAMHVGPYDTLERTYGAITAKMQADGVTPANLMWEHYLTDPADEPDPAKWQTKVCWPMA